MATMTTIEELVAPSVTTVDLADKFLHVTTLSDGYTDTVAGTYVYKVEKDGTDYKVSELKYDAATNTFQVSDEPIIMTDGETIFYITGTTTEPYYYPAVNETEVEAHMNKEKQILQAFLAFAHDEFTFGVYNSFIAEHPYVYEA